MADETREWFIWGAVSEPSARMLAHNLYIDEIARAASPPFAEYAFGCAWAIKARLAPTQLDTFLQFANVEFGYCPADAGGRELLRMNLALGEYDQIRGVSTEGRVLLARTAFLDAVDAYVGRLAKEKRIKVQRW